MPLIQEKSTVITGLPLELLGTLIRLINRFNEGIDPHAYALERICINYKADMEYPLPMIYGCSLPLRYDKRSKTFLLDFRTMRSKIILLAMITANYLSTNEDVSDLAQEILAFV